MIRARRDLLPLLAAVALTLVGLACIAVAIGVNVNATTTRATWVSSPEGRAAERVLAEPTPIWLSPASETVTPLPAQPALIELAVGVAAPPTPIPGVPLTDAGVSDARFVFLDPPEPGARARLTLPVHVGSTPSATSLTLAIPLGWFDGYRIASVATSSIDDSSQPGWRRIVLPQVTSGDNTIALDFVATGERVDAPLTRVMAEPGNVLIGEVQARTFAPRPRPGPVSALRIPRLGLRVAVVPTTWEPPAFVAGQIRGTANVMSGNSVLIGHLGGAAGDVFKNLERLQTGDSVVAVSRGIEYTFIVSDKQVRGADDSRPAAPYATPRLTLMTCSGDWDPLTRNYSERLWITAEPWDLAAQTIVANAARPPTPVPVESPAAPAQTSGTVVGLGAERAAVERLLGAPLGETPGKLVVYRAGSIEYHVRYTADPPRAELIGLDPLGGASDLSIPTVVEQVHAQLPTDASPRARGPEGNASQVVERLASAALANALGRPTDDGRNFIAVYARDAQGKVTRAVVAAADDADQALLDASR